MAGDNPPKQPAKHSEGREQANRIAEIGHRIADMGHLINGAIRDLGNQIFTLTNQIQADSKTTDTREKEHQDRSLRWFKIGTYSSIIFSFFSLITSSGALYVVNRQLDTMHIEQRAWIKIDHTATQFSENKPLIAEVIIKNTGKTPAHRVEADFMVQIVKKDAPPDLKLSGTVFNATGGILNPDTAISVPVPMLKGTSDILNPPVLTKSDIAEIHEGGAYIVVFGKVTYFDVYGISHWIDFCGWQATGMKAGNYSSLKCSEYNNVDNN